MKPGRAQTRTHDYKRHGTTRLFAALDVATGEVIAECKPRHRHDEFLAFLKTVARKTPKDLELHAIVDNYSAYKHRAVRAWLAKNQRVHLHFTATSASWLNPVERLFAELTENVSRRGSFTSVKAPEQAVEAYLAKKDERSKPYTWTTTVEEILAKLGRAQSALEVAKDSSVTAH